MGPVIIIADGKEIGRYQDACIPSFSPDSKHLAYLAEDDTNDISLFVDGKKEKSYSKPEVKCSFVFNAYMIGPNMNILFSCKYLSDGRLLILTQDKNGWVVYKNSEVLETYLQNVWGGGQLRTYKFGEYKTTQSIVAWSLTTAEESPTAIWWERLLGEEERWRIVKDGKPVDSIVCTDSWHSQRPVVSANGLHCGYVAITKASSSESKDIHTIIDGKKYGPYDNIWGITFTNDGKHFAYLATEPNEKRWSVFLDGKPLSSKYESGSAPILSYDGVHIAWKEYRESKVAISMDGNELALEDKVVWGPRFEGTEKVSWIIIEDNRILRRSFTLTGAKKQDKILIEQKQKNILEKIIVKSVVIIPTSFTRQKPYLLPVRRHYLLE